MSFGFKAVNDWGTVQLDETYKSLQLRSKFQLAFERQISFLYNWGTGYVYHTVIRYRGRRPMVFWRTGVYAFMPVCYSTDISPGEHERDWEIYICTNDPNGAPITVWIFEEVDLIGAAGGYGLVVYNGQGQRTFDSRLHQLKLRGAHTFDHRDTDGSAWVYPSGTYAIGHGRVGGSSNPTAQTGPFQVFETSRVFIVVDNGFRQGEIPLIHSFEEEARVQRFNVTRTINDVLLIDVAGL